MALRILNRVSNVSRASSLCGLRKLDMRKLIHLKSAETFELYPNFDEPVDIFNLV